MTKKIKLIASDLDGTLLNDHKVISNTSIQKLIDYEKQGYCLVLASGRYFREIHQFAEQLHLADYEGYVVCGNGYEIIDVKKMTSHTFEKISKTISHECIDIASKHHLMQFICIHNRYHLSCKGVTKKTVQAIRSLTHTMTKKGIKQLSYFSKLLDESVLDVDLKNYIDEDIVKICVIGTPRNQRAWIEELEKTYPNTFAYYPVNSYSLEITHKSVSKKNAVEEIAKSKGYTLENVIAFGDSGNDDPLLQAAGIGITMKNGTRRALSRAKHISEFSNHDDGVVKELEKYLK